MKLAKSITIRHQGQTYRGEVPDKIAEKLNLKPLNPPKKKEK